MVWVLSPCCTLNEDSGTGCTQCECDDVARGTAIAASDLGYSVHTFAIGESNFKLGYTELHVNRPFPLVAGPRRRPRCCRHQHAAAADAAIAHDASTLCVHSHIWIAPRGGGDRG